MKQSTAYLIKENNHLHVTPLNCINIIRSIYTKLINTKNFSHCLFTWFITKSCFNGIFKKYNKHFIAYKIKLHAYTILNASIKEVLRNFSHFT